MKLITRFFRSLFLAIAFSFFIAFLFLGAVWGAFAGVGYIPGLETAGHAAANAVCTFLQVFGSGSPFNGMLVIGLTFGFVGALFDVYTFYRCENIRHY
jgi:hypothetical protein